MPFFLLLLLALLSLQAEWPQPPSWIGEWGSLGAAAAGLLAFWLSAAWLAHRQTQRLARDAEMRSLLLPRFQTHRRRHFLMLGAFFLIALFSLGWGWTVRQYWGEWPGVEVILLAPFLAGLTLLWSHYYEVDRAAHELTNLPGKLPFPSRAAYIALQARHNLLLIVPPLFLIVIQQTVFFLVPKTELHPSILAGFALGLLLLALISMPYVLKRFLSLVPLPDGPVRDRLFDSARRLGLRFSDILLWPTRHTVANAMVTGLFSWNRYIVVTDRLVQELNADEIDAVFGHEVGHVKHHHLWCYLVFILASLAALAGLAQAAQLVAQQPAVKAWLGTWLPPDHAMAYVAPLATVGVIGLYLFLVFGFLSRRCERQADLFGCRSTDAPTFVAALEKVADLNGIHRTKPGLLSCWLHGTIGQRVAFLQGLTTNPQIEPMFQKRVRWLKWCLPCALILIALGLAAINAQLSAQTTHDNPNGAWDMLKWL